MPPNITNKKAEEAALVVNEDISRMKLKLENPVVVVAGDVNQFGIYNCVQDHADITVVPPLETRGNARLDQLATNCIEEIEENIMKRNLEQLDCSIPHYFI